MLLLWMGVLLGPAAWGISLATLFWLTHPVCQGGERSSLWTVGAVCLAMAVGACVVSGVSLARAGFPPERSGIAPFMMRMAVGLAAIFSLVILLSMVPIAMLTPCPL
jgi:hypothetical protein